MTHSLDDALKPCPFCETAPHLEANGAVKGGQIVVTDCQRGCPLSRAYIEVAAWNTRAALEAAGVAELREDARSAAAIAWIMAMSETDVDWSARILNDYRDSEHYGDCTKAPITCNRCVCDEALEAADAALTNQGKAQG